MRLCLSPEEALISFLGCNRFVIKAWRSKRGIFPAAEDQDKSMFVDHSHHAAVVVSDSFVCWNSDDEVTQRSSGAFGHAFDWSAGHPDLQARFCNVLPKKGRFSRGDPGHIP